MVPNAPGPPPSVSRGGECSVHDRLTQWGKMPCRTLIRGLSRPHHPINGPRLGSAARPPPGRPPPGRPGDDGMLLPRRVERGPASPPSYRAIPPWVVPDLPQAPQPPAEYLDDFGLAGRRIVMDSPSPGSDGLLGRQGCLRRGHPGLDRGHGDRDGRRDRRRREPDGDGARSARRLPLRRDAGTRSTQPDGGAITVVSPDAIPALAGARPGGVALGLLFRVRVSVLLALGVAAWYLAPTELVEGHLRRLAGHPPASDRPGPPLDSPARPGASGGEPDARRAAPGRAPPRDYERRRDRRIRGHAGLGYVCPDGCRRAELGAPGLPSWVSLEPSRGRRDVAPSSQPGSSDSGRSLVGLAEARAARGVVVAACRRLPDPGSLGERLSWLALDPARAGEEPGNAGTHLARSGGR